MTKGKIKIDPINDESGYGIYIGELDKDRNPCGRGIKEYAEFTSDIFILNERYPCLGK